MSIKAIFLYNTGSEGGRELKSAMGVKGIKHTKSSFKGNADTTILNWGAGTDRLTNREALKCNILNHPRQVDIAVNKTQSFNLFREHGVSHPEFTASREEAMRWVESGTMVFARTLVTSHSGRGISIMDPDHPDTWEVTAPLYVKYIKKQHEYRIHVLRDQVIDTQRKGLREELRGREGVNFKIRNHANGFIYVRNDGHIVPPVVSDVGIAAVRALGLDFGAVDVIYNQQSGRAYALECNSAPGISGTTVESYARAFAAL